MDVFGMEENKIIQDTIPTITMLILTIWIGYFYGISGLFVQPTGRYVSSDPFCCMICAPNCLSVIHCGPIDCSGCGDCGLGELNLSGGGSTGGNADCGPIAGILLIILIVIFI